MVMAGEGLGTWKQSPNPPSVQFPTIQTQTNKAHRESFTASWEKVVSLKTGCYVEPEMAHCPTGVQCYCICAVFLGPNPTVLPVTSPAPLLYSTLYYGSLHINSLQLLLSQSKALVSCFKYLQHQKLQHVAQHVLFLWS